MFLSEANLQQWNESRFNQRCERGRWTIVKGTLRLRLAALLDITNIIEAPGEGGKGVRESRCKLCGPGLSLVWTSV